MRCVQASKQASTPNGRRSLKFRKQRTLATSNTEEKAVNSETSHSFAGTNHSDAATFDIYSVSRLGSRFLLLYSIYRSRWVSRRAYVMCTRFEGSVGATRVPLVRTHFLKRTAELTLASDLKTRGQKRSYSYYTPYGYNFDRTEAYEFGPPITVQ